jgi:hypothetical protein
MKYVNKNGIYSDIFILNIFIISLNKYFLKDESWEMDFEQAFYIFMRLSSFQQDLIVKEIAKEFKDRYWFNDSQSYFDELLPGIFEQVKQCGSEGFSYSTTFINQMKVLEA